MQTEIVWLKSWVRYAIKTVQTIDSKTSSQALFSNELSDVQLYSIKYSAAFANTWSNIDYQAIYLTI